MKRLVLLPLSILTLAACETRPDFNDAQYWQRVDTTSALYMQGPKAQQGLHQDIAGCVNDINELKRLGSIKKAVPRNLEAPDEKKKAEWDTPKRDGYRYAEHLDYTDFETCMHSKGWERVDHLPYDVAERSRGNWLETIIGDEDGYKRSPSDNTNITPRDRDAYDDLND